MKKGDPMDVWKSVQVTADGHARNGEAGTVFAVNKKLPDEVAVRFDVDGVVEIVQVADLKAL